MARKKKTEATTQRQSTIINPIPAENKDLIELSDYERELIVKSFELAAKHIPPCYYKDIDVIVQKLRA